MKLIKFFLLFLVTGCSIQVTAQKKPAGQAAVTKLKGPKLQTALGAYKDSAAVSVAEGSSLVATPLKITDEKNNVYSIVSYQFLYKKLGVTEDEQTEKTSPTSTLSSAYFKVTPLSPVWVTTIQQFLQPGEEFYFFDVVVRDSKGNNFLAPSLKLTIR